MPSSAAGKCAGLFCLGSWLAVCSHKKSAGVVLRTESGTIKLRAQQLAVPALRAYGGETRQRSVLKTRWTKCPHPKHIGQVYRGTCVLCGNSPWHSGRW